MPSRLDARAVALAIIIMAILGGTYTMVKVGLRDLPVIGSLLLRMLVAAVVLGAYARWGRVTLLYRGRAAWFIAAGTLAFIAMQLLLYVGLTVTPAGRAAILYNVQPFLTLLVLPYVVPAERLTFRRVMGTGVAFAGVVLVLAERGTSGGSVLGDSLVLLAAGIWTLVIVLSKMTPNEVNAVSLIFWNVAGAARAGPTDGRRRAQRDLATERPRRGEHSLSGRARGRCWLRRVRLADAHLCRDPCQRLRVPFTGLRGAHRLGGPRGVGYGSPSCRGTRGRIRYLDREHGELRCTLWATPAARPLGPARLGPVLRPDHPREDALRNGGREPCLEVTERRRALAPKVTDHLHPGEDLVRPWSARPAAIA